MELRRGQPLDAAKFSSSRSMTLATVNRVNRVMVVREVSHGYRDMVEAEYRLLSEGLGVNHARGHGHVDGRNAYPLWGEIHPDFMDALMPLASLPTQISGRNRALRRPSSTRSATTPRGPGRIQAQPSEPAHRCGNALLMSSN